MCLLYLATCEHGWSLSLYDIVHVCRREGACCGCSLRGAATYPHWIRWGSYLYMLSVGTSSSGEHTWHCSLLLFLAYWYWRLLLWLAPEQLWMWPTLLHFINFTVCKCGQVRHVVVDFLKLNKLYPCTVRLRVVSVFLLVHRNSSDNLLCSQAYLGSLCRERSGALCPRTAVGSNSRTDQVSHHWHKAL